MNLEQGVEPANGYLWQVPGKPLTVEIDFDAVDNILMEVMQGFGAVPRRGVEVGGILLGKAEGGDSRMVRVADFEPVLCEHARGPSYLLSEADRRRFRETLERWGPEAANRLYAVGMFRSHTRDGLALSEHDLDVFNECFPDPAAVFLLVKPFATRVSVGGFFFREEGRIRSESSYLEFPFRRRELGGHGAASESFESPVEESRAAQEAPGVPETQEEEADRRQEPDVPEPVPEAAGPVVEPEAAEPAVVEAPRLKRNVWIPLSFIFLLVGVLLGFQAALSFRPAGADGGRGTGAEVFSVGLETVKNGDNLHLKWNRQALAITKARSAALTITDGTYNNLIQLDPSQLARELVIYRHITNRVIFRLEIFCGERSSLVETAIFETVAPLTAPAPGQAPSK